MNQNNKNGVKIIAEIGINHNGDSELAKQLIMIAKAAGCDYVKFQKRNPDICVPEEQKNKIESATLFRVLLPVRNVTMFSLIEMSVQISE